MMALVMVLLLLMVLLLMAPVRASAGRPLIALKVVLLLMPSG